MLNSKDGHGTSVIITRSPLAESIIQEEIQKSTIAIEKISSDTMRASQQGGYNQRYEGLHLRLKKARKKYTHS